MLTLSELQNFHSFFQCERMFPRYLWFARVLTFYNIADHPSRGRVEQTAAKFSATVVSVTIAKDEIREIQSFKARHKNLEKGLRRVPCLGAKGDD